VKELFMLGSTRFFNQYLLLTVATSFLMGNNASLAMESSEESKRGSDSYHTPLKTKTMQEELSQTPGFVVAQKQSNLFSRDKFVQIFGEKDIKILDEVVDWEAFSNKSMPFDAPERRNSLRFIRKFLGDNSSLSDEADTLYPDMLKLEDQTKRAHLDRMKEITKQYFGVENNQVVFPMKQAGDQLGTRIQINFEGQEPITYHVKTHSAGLKSAMSSAAKILDPKELVVYKILENFNIGCESHFFGRDFDNFYIATKDASNSGDVFLTYGKIRDQKKLQTSLIGNLQELIDNTEQNPNNEAQDFMESMMCLDLLGRILRLTDFQTNPTNFGFLKDKFQLKAVDFRMQQGIVYEVNEDHWGGFLRGNGDFEYSDADAYMLYALKERSKEARFETAKNVFQRLFFDFERVLRDSQESAVKSLNNIANTQNEPLDGRKKNLKEAIEKYISTLRHNFEFFASKLNG